MIPFMLLPARGGSLAGTLTRSLDSSPHGSIINAFWTFSGLRTGFQEDLRRKQEAKAISYLKTWAQKSQEITSATFYWSKQS